MAIAKCPKCRSKLHLSCGDERGHINGLHIFKKDVEPALEAQLNALLEDLSGPLMAHLMENCNQYRPLMYRIRMLGKEEASAKLWLVVLCPAPVVKHVEAFFQKDHIRQTLAQIHVPDELEAVYVGRALRFRSGCWDDVDVALDDTVERHIWSRAITLQQMSKVNHATMGGMLIAKNAEGMEAIFGLTVGHLLHHGDATATQAMDLDPTTNANLAAVSNNTMIGKVAKVSFSEQARNMDWALVEFSEKQTLMNYIDQSGPEAFALGNCRGAVAFRPPVISSGEFQISDLPARLMCPGGNVFIKVHPIVNTKNDESEFSELPEGKSGSWVVSNHAKVWRKIGHTMIPILSMNGIAVADDGYGDMYMIPLADIMNDIRQILGVSVSLPDDTSEILRLLQLGRFSLDKENPVASPSAAGEASRPLVLWLCSECGNCALIVPHSWGTWCEMCGHSFCSACTAF